MKKTLIIAKKEFAGFFTSSLACVLLFIAVATFNFFFFLLIDENREASLRDMFLLMEFIFLFIIPLFTMKAIAEEKHAGTMEFLMTSPATNGEIILGKYLGNLAFVSLIIALTTVYYAIIEFFSAPDAAMALSGYLGIWLETAFFVAFGMLASSLTSNQLISALSAYVALLALYFAPAMGKFLGASSLGFLDYICFSTHLKNLSSGLVLSADLIYFSSGILFCLGASRLALENKLWK